ncbi:hypothetical protein J7M23_04835 [Candidatus Sumerlaeota bacterium]|nr:hypothetical protein [Candidatus Sumerlaeota bacterium]
MVTKIAVALVCIGLLFAFGCASVQKATTFNGLDLTAEGKTNVGHYNAKNWGLYLLGIPLITGDTDKISEITEKGMTINTVFLKDTVNLDSVSDMLTRVAEADGATIIEDLSSSRSNTLVFLVFFIRSVQMSANGVK